MRKKEKVEGPESEPAISLNISASLDGEFVRIKNTLSRMDWYVENGYKPALPPELQPILNEKRIIADDEIKKFLERNFDEGEYETKFGELLKGWKGKGQIFIEKLKSVGLEIENKYEIRLTKYGTGGSYNQPNNITINIESTKREQKWHLLAHEIIHLAVQDWINKYQIGQWEKEKIVDLIGSRTLDSYQFQNYNKDVLYVEEIFNEHFPNIEKVIEKVSLKQSKHE
jgi:hypothetical protein